MCSINRDDPRFWARVQKGDGCWEWRGVRTPDGYGCCKRGREQRAHRIAWIMYNGPIPAGAWVLHRCDNRACVNPVHLSLGDHDANMRDMVSRRRRQRARCKYGHPFTEETTGRQSDGHKRCRICERKVQREYKRRVRSIPPTRWRVA